MRDRILFGIKNQQVRERLLREANLSLSRTMDICRAAESTAAQMKDINKMADGTVHVIKKVHLHEWQDKGQDQAQDRSNVGGDWSTGFGLQVLWKGARATQGTLSSLGQDLLQMTAKWFGLRQVSASCRGRQN